MPLSAEPSSNSGLSAATETAWLDVSLGAIERNFRAVVARTGHGGYAVVKADAYGHGAARVAAHLLRHCGADLHGFCVARPQEAEALLTDLRVVRPQPSESPPVVVFGVFPSALEDPARDQLAAHRATFGWVPVCSSLSDLAWWGEAAGVHPLPVQLELDVGMQRTGISPGELGEARELLRQGSLCLQGFFAHPSESEVANSEVTLAQRKLFTAAARTLEAERAGGSLYLHFANSCASLDEHEALSNSFRIGGALYGLDLGAWADGSAARWAGAMQVSARIVQTRCAPAGSRVGYGGTHEIERPTTLATLAIGYADGLPRTLTGAEVWWRDRRRAVVGRVSMDLAVIDLGEVLAERDPANLAADPVVVIGGGRPPESGCTHSPASVLEWSRWSGRLPYEITCGFSRRLPRRFV